MIVGCSGGTLFSWFMITLYGRFKSSDAYNRLKVLKSLRICSFEITSEDVEDNRTTKSIGSSTVNVLLQHTIKLCLPQVLSELYQLVGYFLGGGEGFYGNESLFIGCKVSPFVTHIDFAPQISTSGLKFRGTIRAIGSVFDLNTGISVLLDVVDDFECNTVFLLTGEAVRIRGFLSIGDKIEIINPKKFYWGSNTARGGVPNDQFSDSYIVTCIASVVHLARTDLDASSIVDMLSIGLYNQLSSKCLVTRDILAHQEIDVELEIIAVHLTGWIRVSVRDGPQQQQHFYLYVAHTHVAWVMHVFRHAIGATVRACNVLPVFLWNKMRGFAFTGRSSISVLTLPKALVDVNSKSSSGILTVPAEIRESCHMYTAFRADLTHRLSESVLNLSSMKHASRRLVLCIELMACDYQQQLPSSSTSSEYKDMFILYNDLPLTDARSLIRQSASLKKLTHGKYSMQEEFSSAWHAAFYAVRGGCDIDSLCAQLPYVVSVKSIFRNIEQKVRTAVARCGLASLRLFATHVVELFAKDDGSHPLNLIVAGSLVKWESMRCGEGGQFCSLCVVRDAEGEELQVIVTDCAQSTSRELEKLAGGYANTSMSGGVSFRVLLDGCGEVMRVVESPPVVLIHRPMCVFEENPSNSKTLADVKLIASARDIKLFSPQSCPPTPTIAPEDQNDRTGIPQKRKFGDLSEAPTVPTSFTARCSVRDILLRFVDRSRGSVSVTAAVYGVVIYKEKNLAFGLKKQRCALTLRDEVFDDSLILYIPLVSAALVTVGMHIEVNESRLSVSKGKKESLYLDFVRGIRITKIADTATMQRLCQRNLLSAYAATALNRTYIHQTPPAITLEKLYNSSRVSTSSLATCPDRVLWTLTGHIIFIREIHVRLRCKSCYTNLANRYCVCSKGCGGGASSTGAVRYTLTFPNYKPGGGSREPLSHEESLRMSIVWEMTCVFDDGSGDCCVQFDGEEEVRAYLREAHYPSAQAAVARIIDRINEKVRGNGAFFFQIFDTVEKKKFSVLPNNNNNNNNPSALDAAAVVEDYMDEADDQCCLSAAIRASIFSQVAGFIGRDEVNLALALHLKCMRRSSLWQFSGRRSGMAERDGGGCHVKVQAANGVFPYQVRFCKVPVPVPVPDGKRLLLTGYNLRILERDNLRLEAWKMLEKLND